jgi:hypothetical protein
MVLQIWGKRVVVESYKLARGNPLERKESFILDKQRRENSRVVSY